MGARANPGSAWFADGFPLMTLYPSPTYLPSTVPHCVMREALHCLQRSVQFHALASFCSAHSRLVARSTQRSTHSMLGTWGIAATVPSRRAVSTAAARGGCIVTQRMRCLRKECLVILVIVTCAAPFCTALTSTGSPTVGKSWKRQMTDHHKISCEICHRRVACPPSNVPKLPRYLSEIGKEESRVSTNHQRAMAKFSFVHLPHETSARGYSHSH